MGERKVQNRYIPPDFDPSILPSTKRDYTKLIEVRMMLPFSMKCLMCGNYMYRGKKFNSKKETLQEETYLGIRIHRFYIKCSVCSAEITFRTDPKNTDYALESGATRNFEMWRENDEIAEKERLQREEEDKLDAMKGLENRTLESKVEMDILDALDEIKAINQRHERIDTHEVLKKLNYPSVNDNTLFTTSVSNTGSGTLSRDGLTEEDEKLLHSFRSRKRSMNVLSDDESDRDDKKQMKLEAAGVNNIDANSDRKDHDKTIIEEPKEELRKDLSLFDKIQNEITLKQATKSDALPAIIVKKRKRNDATVEVVETKTETTNAVSLFGSYGSDSD